MRKDELLHLHSLFALLRSEYVERGLASPAQFSEYDDLEISPMAVYESKNEHARAVRTLAQPLASVSGESPDRSAAVTSP